MKDRVFSGKDLAEALSEASRTLGLPEARLRYVVLEAGAPGGLGTSATPARVAVLLEEAPGRPAAAPVTAREAEPGDPLAGLRGIVEAVARAAGLTLELSVEEGPEAVELRLAGPDAGFFRDEDGERMEALEHLLQRMFGERLRPRRVRLEGAHQRQRREAELRSLAQQLIAQVRQDGLPRSTRPLNSYERRIIHVTVSAASGLRSFSVGDAREKRVTIAPEAADPGPEGGE